MLWFSLKTTIETLRLNYLYFPCILTRYFSFDVACKKSLRDIQFRQIQTLYLITRPSKDIAFSTFSTISGFSIFIPYLISCHNKKTQDNANARKVTFQLLPNGCFKLSLFQAARIWKFNLLCYLLRGVIGQFLKNKKLHIYFGKYVSYIKFNQHSRSLDFLWEHIREYRTCFTPQKYCCFRVASHAARDSILISSRLFKPRSLSVSFISWNTEKSQYML